MIRIFLLIFLITTYSLGTAQTPLSESTFINLVKTNHPLIKISQLQPRIGDAEVLKAKGNFDPKIQGNMDQKYYDGKQYYSLSDYGIKYPTWYGITVKTGLESNRGSYIDPQAKTPMGGLFYGGIQANLGQGLFIDQRRATLWNAELIQKSSIEEQRLQANKLIYEAGYAYWEWYLDYHSLQILQEAYDVAFQRFVAVKQTALLGDRAFVDTVEAGLQVQNRLALLEEAKIALQKQQNVQSAFLWSENLEPLELENSSSPSARSAWQVSYDPIDSIALLIQNHPYLKITDFKIDMLEIDRNLKADRLKPLLQVNYNLLNEPVNYNPFSDLDINDYKWGISLEMPIFLRRERGDLQLAKLKLNETQLNLAQLNAQVALKIKNARLELQNSIIQLSIYQQTVDDSKRLLDAERNMFNNGESSLFLMNMRELNYIQSQIKYLEWQAKNKQLAYSLGFAAATLF